MTVSPDDPIWNELPDGANTIELDGEVVGIGWGEEEDVDFDQTNAVLAKAGLPLLPDERP